MVILLCSEITVDLQRESWLALSGKKRNNAVKKHCISGDEDEESEKEDSYSGEDSDEYSSEEFDSEFDSDDESNHLIRNRSPTEVSTAENFDFDPTTETSHRSEETEMKEDEEKGDPEITDNAAVKTRSGRF
ncbi:unnamed protein product [Caenorhabditis brenneri]